MQAEKAARAAVSCATFSYHAFRRSFIVVESAAVVGVNYVFACVVIACQFERVEWCYEGGFVLALGA